MKQSEKWKKKCDLKTNLHNSSTFFQVTSVSARVNDLAFSVFFVVVDWAFWQVASRNLAFYYRLCGGYSKQSVDGSKEVGVIYGTPMTHFICSLLY